MLSIWLIAASTSIAAYAVTWAVRFVAPKLGYLDAPDGARKIHQCATPLLGGIAVFLSFALGVIILLLMPGSGVQDVDSSFVWGLLLSGCLFCCLGLWDDRWPLRARYKFVLQILAATPFVLLGSSIAKLNCLGLQIDLGVFAIPFTIFWIVSCVNIVNLIDGMDGLAATIGLIASTTLAILSFSLGHATMGAIGLLFAASLLGFLFHNWPPARIFLGDAGSLTIGFVIGGLSTGGALKTATGFVLIFPAVLLAIPIADTALAIIRRKLMGQGIGDGDRGHIHHRLQERGLSKLKSLMVISGLCIAMAVVVVVAGRIQSDWLALVLGIAILVIGFQSRVLGFHELHLARRSLQIFLQVVRNAATGLQAKMSFLRLTTSDTRNHDSLWELVEDKAKLAGAVEVELVIEDVPTSMRNVVRRWSPAGNRDFSIVAWDIHYRVKRTQDTHVAFMARGVCADEGQQQAFESLPHLSAEICRIWPVDSPAIFSIQDHLPVSAEPLEAVGRAQRTTDRQAA